LHKSANHSARAAQKDTPASTALRAARTGVHCDAEDYYTPSKDATKNREKPPILLGNIQKTIIRP
jgi:hypothetical protein